MKFVKLDASPLFNGSITRLNNAVVSVSDLGLEVITPVLVDSSEPGYLEETDPKVDFFLWSDLLQCSEDRGVVIIYADYQNSLKWEFEQVITRTLATKEFPFQYKQEKLILGYLLTPYKRCQLGDATLVLRDDGCVDLSSVTFDAIASYVDNQFEPYRFFKWIGINSPSSANAGSIVELQVTPPFSQPDIFLEATAGSLNRSRLNGSKTVLLNTTGLSVGDKIKVKVGYKFWPGESEVFIDLV